MLSMQRSVSHLSTPWFARPAPVGLLPPRGGGAPLRSMSPMTSEEEVEEFEPEKSFYEDQDLDISFRHRYPPREKKQKSLEEICLPKDPRTWMREDVQTWIRQMADLHGLPHVQTDRFLMNGKALCLMTMDMFCQRVPLGGKMLYKDFQLRLSMAMYHS